MRWCPAPESTDWPVGSSDQLNHLTNVFLGAHVESSCPTPVCLTGGRWGSVHDRSAEWGLELLSSTNVEALACLPLGVGQELHQPPREAPPSSTTGPREACGVACGVA